ncbi:hypothetical protein NECAME_13598 [Necator americanus]|uniref:Pao retrotransposon peptidase n=1 Tax=Necator americanus TaxID=51031 RepID=W2SU53_NECAM|nr:hypothetical protein NECAME_13598 [Necator americanus]ETN73175.1 hypothetical protein NECAME_13598 [Necator americanus]
MNVRKWTSSDEQVNDTIDSHETTPMDKTAKILGIHQQQWNDITSSWTTLFLEIPRRLLTAPKRRISSQLHILTDASQAAYCTVAYLRSTTDKGADIKLLMVRIRLSPLHSAITIPRLELTALTLGSTLMKHVTKEMNIQLDQQYLWSDSKAALHLVKTTTRLPIFIANRVKAIKLNAADAILRHVPSSSNPADIGSRGTSIEELLENDQW